MRSWPLHLQNRTRQLITWTSPPTKVRSWSKAPWSFWPRAPSRPRLSFCEAS